MAQNNLDTKTLENWLWEAACKIRGPIDAPKYKDYILPLIFLKRLSDVFEDELNEMSREFGSLEKAEEFSRIDPGLVRFYLPTEARWSEVAKKTTNLGEYLTDVLRNFAGIPEKKHRKKLKRGGSVVRNIRKKGVSPGRLQRMG